MSFSFGFSGEDIDDEGIDVEDNVLAAELSKQKISDSKHDDTHTVQPKRYTFEELLSYNTLYISSKTTATSEPQPPNSSNPIKVYRRSLFDIRAQLMAEANPSAEATEAHSAETLLAGLENGDLTAGIYEGGFKTWECALDLASLLISNQGPLSHGDNVDVDWNIVELGAGSAVPSLALLRQCLEEKRISKIESTRSGRLTLTLCDYNEDVLRLATVPNILLNYFSATNEDNFFETDQAQDGEGDLDLEDRLLDGKDLPSSVANDLLAKDISLNFVSGGWSKSFLELLDTTAPNQVRSGKDTDLNHPPTNLLVLASETIYSPASIETFSSTLIQFLRSHPRRHGPAAKARAWVAAKKVYFGVGGGVDEFMREIRRLGATSTVIFESQDAGVGRVVLEVHVA